MQILRTKMAFLVSLEQHFAIIAPTDDEDAYRHEEESRTYVNIQAVRSANVTHYVLARWRPAYAIHKPFV